MGVEEWSGGKLQPSDAIRLHKVTSESVISLYSLCNCTVANK